MLYMLMLFQWLPQAATCQVDIGAKVIFGQGGWDSCSGPSLRIKDFGHFCDDLTPILPGGFWMLKRYTLRLQCASGLQIKKATCYIVLIKYRYYHIDIIWDYQSPFFCWCIWSQNMKSETAPFHRDAPLRAAFSSFQRLGSETKASHVTWRWYGASHIFPPRPLAIQWNTVKPCESPTLRHRFESLLPWRTQHLSQHFIFLCIWICFKFSAKGLGPLAISTACFFRVGLSQKKKSETCWSKSACYRPEPQKSGTKNCTSLSCGRKVNVESPVHAWHRYLSLHPSSSHTPVGWGKSMLTLLPTVEQPNLRCHPLLPVMACPRFPHPWLLPNLADYNWFSGSRNTLHCSTRWGNQWSHIHEIIFLYWTEAVNTF